MGLTLLDEEVRERQHDGVAAIQIISTHGVGTCDGEAPTGNHLHYPPHLYLPVSKKLKETQTAVTKV